MPAGLAEIGAALKARLEGPWLWPAGAPLILSESDGLVDAGDLGVEGEVYRSLQLHL